MKVLLVKRRSGTLSVIKCGCEDGRPAQDSRGKGQQGLSAIRMGRQGGVYGEGVNAMSHQSLQPLNEQLMRFTCLWLRSPWEIP